jgi:hypothetical protein
MNIAHVFLPISTQQFGGTFALHDTTPYSLKMCPLVNMDYAVITTTRYFIGRKTHPSYITGEKLIFVTKH